MDTSERMETIRNRLKHIYVKEADRDNNRLDYKNNHGSIYKAHCHAE